MRSSANRLWVSIKRKLNGSRSVILKRRIRSWGQLGQSSTLSISYSLIVVLFKEQLGLLSLTSMCTPIARPLPLGDCIDRFTTFPLMKEISRLTSFGRLGCPDVGLKFTLSFIQRDFRFALSYGMEGWLAFDLSICGTSCL